MTKKPVDAMTDSELVAKFAECCVQQDVALLGKGTAWFRLHYGRMTEVREELKRRNGDQRRLLLVLFSHPNMQARLQAAKSTLAVAPTEARRQLEDIIASKWFPQAGDAGMCLHLLDDGFFKPS